MRKILGLVVSTAILSASSVSAHFVFIVPDTGGNARIIFSDTLKPDENVAIEKIDNTKLSLRDADGKDQPLEKKVDKSSYLAAIPGEGTRIVHGSTSYGVLQRGDSKPFLLTYYSKTVLGDFVTAEKATLGNVPVEIVPIVEGKTIRFQALVNGKPLAKAEINVMPPEEKSENLVGDEKGLTKAFEKSGLYGVRVRLI